MYLYHYYLNFLQWMRRKRLGLSVRSVRVGANVRVSQPDLLRTDEFVGLGDHVRVRGNVSLGKNTDIRAYTLLDARGGHISIGENCSVNDFCIFYGMGNIIIGNDVRIAAHTLLISGDHRFDDIDTLIRLQGVNLKPIVIEDNVWIAANVCILGGITIGTGSVIGAGSVVTRSIPSQSVAVGNPARVIKRRESLNDSNIGKNEGT